VKFRPFNSNLPFGKVVGEQSNGVMYQQGGVDYDNLRKPCKEQSQIIKPFNPDVETAKALESFGKDNQDIIDKMVQERVDKALAEAGLDPAENTEDVILTEEERIEAEVQKRIDAMTSEMESDKDIPDREEKSNAPLSEDELHEKASKDAAAEELAENKRLKALEPEPLGKVTPTTTGVIAAKDMTADQLKAAVEQKDGVFTNRNAALKFLNKK